MIIVKDLKKNFGSTEVLKGINYEIDKGEKNRQKIDELLING